VIKNPGDDFRLESVRPADIDSSAKPFCFQPTEVLFEGTDSARRCDLDLDRVRSGMLDGRTIHFHVQFVEPELLAEHPFAREFSEIREIAAFSPAKLVEPFFRMPTGIGRTIVKSVYGSSHHVLAPINDLSSVVQHVRSALAELARVNLDWLPELALGAFADARCNLEPLSYTAFLPPPTAGQVAAVAVIDDSARWLVQMWLQAEARCGGHDADTVDAASLFAGQAFSSLMIAEYRHRSDDLALSKHEEDLREQVLSDFPLTRHLINFWDRRWNRQAFLSGSVFDYASDLPSLYEGWRA
jgi:hypothetical protein